MIIFFESGRLGNQLFQYTALRALYPQDRLILVGFNDLHRFTARIDAIIISRDMISRAVAFGLRHLIFMLSRLYIIGIFSESRICSTYQITMRRGLIPHLSLARSSYFQHQYIINKIKDISIEIREEHVIAASNWLNSNNIISNLGNLVFVHIRRGDYLNWPNREAPAVLDIAWYLLAISQIRMKIDNPIFIILTDDVHYAKDFFDDQPNIYISNNNQFVDLVIMSICKHGILSPSSYAWWGSRLGINKKKCSIFLAPKYWAGHRTKTWFPEGFVSDWITYI